jgi:BlaI family transcriptional regulator, penicillinase repressor
LTKVFVNDGRMRKMLKPTAAELRILRVLWAGGPLSVRQVQTALAVTYESGYTSVLKTLQIMADKGLVDRDASVRPQRYSAKHSEDRTQRQMLTDLIQRAYGGSVKALVLHAVGQHSPSARDLRELERLLNKLEGERP